MLRYDRVECVCVVKMTTHTTPWFLGSPQAELSCQACLWRNFWKSSFNRRPWICYRPPSPWTWETDSAVCLHRAMFDVGEIYSDWPWDEHFLPSLKEQTLMETRDAEWRYLSLMLWQLCWLQFMAHRVILKIVETIKSNFTQTVVNARHLTLQNKFEIVCFWRKNIMLTKAAFIWLN